MSPELHQRFIETAEWVSLKLQNVLQEIGPIAFPDQMERGLTFFLGRAVVGQQLSTHAARTIWMRIEEAASKHGCSVPEFFREERFQILQKCGASGNKVKALLSIRKAHEQGMLSPAYMETMTALEKASHLQKIWGIGKWTADMASIFYFQELDVWPEGDSAVQRTFRMFVDEASVVDAAKAFSPYRSYLALYMWRIVDGAP